MYWGFMMKMVLLLLVLVLPSAVYGMVFTWTDSMGITHYTNKEYEIPSRYRVKAKHLYPEQPDVGASQQSTPAVLPASPKPDVQPAQQATPVVQQPVVNSAPQVEAPRPSSYGRARRVRPPRSPSDE